MSAERVVGHVLSMVGIIWVCEMAAPAALADPPDAAERQQALRALGKSAALTVFPVQLADTAQRNVAEVIGVLLEQQGMPNIAVSSDAFVAPAGTEFGQLGGLFAEFVGQHPPKTEYALFAQIMGTPQTGAQEIRTVLADRSGDVVWCDRQTPADADFKRINPQEPMTCCVLVVERLKTVLNLSGADHPVVSGRLTQQLRAESGVPDDEVFGQMEKRQAMFRKAHGQVTLAVYPVKVNNAVDRKSADHLVELINHQHLARATVHDTASTFEVVPSPNEQKRLWELARAFQADVRQNPPSTDYAVLAEYTIKPSTKQVWTVHVILCDKSGEWVVVDYQNNHQQDFNRVRPKTIADCDELVLRRLEFYF